MVTHSNILAWRIPGTEEPGGLQSTGSQSWTRLSHLASGTTCWSLFMCPLPPSFLSKRRLFCPSRSPTPSLLTPHLCYTFRNPTCSSRQASSGLSSRMLSCHTARRHFLSVSPLLASLLLCLIINVTCITAP